MAQKLLNLWAEDGANIIDDDTTATLTLENTSTGTALSLRQSYISNSTVAPLQVLNSCASGVMLDFVGGILSSASINMGASKVVAAVRVHFKGVGGDGFGYIPILTGVS